MRETTREAEGSMSGELPLIETATKPRPGPGTRGGSAVTDGSAGNGAATRPHVFEVEGRL
jgi:hypothetical protein